MAQKHLQGEVQRHSKLEKEFELERMVLFSDAVFAIAITLMVIDIKWPGNVFLLIPFCTIYMNRKTRKFKPTNTAP